jgi:hypothetical protein
MPRTLHLLGLGEKLATSAAHLPDGDFGPWAEIESGPTSAAALDTVSAIQA